MIRTVAFAIYLSLAATAPVAALQSLVPTPYPSQAPGAAPLNPETPDPDGPQRLLRDPYPQILGDDAQGNPPVSRTRRHQHLIPSIYQRKYRVDRP